MIRSVLSTIWEWLSEPAKPEESLTGSALVVYRQAHEAGMRDYGSDEAQEPTPNPYDRGTRFFKLWKMGYRNGRDAAMSVW